MLRTISCALLVSLGVLATAAVKVNGGGADLKGWSGSFRSIDIGNPSLPGSAKASAAGDEIVAGGKDIWGTNDQFHFAYQRSQGDFDVAVQIRSLTAPHLYARAGIMARSDLSDNSQHIFFLVFPDNRPRHNNTSAYELQYREAKGGDSKAIYPPQNSAAPLFPVDFPHAWLRLRRAGNEFTSFASEDGSNWKPYASYSMTFPQNVYLGLAVTSHTDEATIAADFGTLRVIHNPQSKPSR
jgi:hypothetical protein